MAKDYSDFSKARKFEPRESVDNNGNDITENKAECFMHLAYNHFGIKNIDEFN
ncbi:hypothetical protein [Halonatronum saccharophilum]|uniref:hypothetical protein n=1 Tax=Halonatronum saccharophilum TaxID=150060 RepID=UPI0004AC7E00|nr:hypothetical protein [Halonatronum saccharophilum]